MSREIVNLLRLSRILKVKKFTASGMDATEEFWSWKIFHSARAKEINEADEQLQTDAAMIWHETLLVVRQKTLEELL